MFFLVVFMVTIIKGRDAIAARSWSVGRVVLLKVPEGMGFKGRTKR